MELELWVIFGFSIASAMLGIGATLMIVELRDEPYDEFNI